MACAIQIRRLCGRVKPDFEPIMFKPAETLGKAIGLMEAMIRWFGKREMLHVMMDQSAQKPLCWEGDSM